MKIVEGARYEISVDGAMRTHRDTWEMANVLKACRPYSKVVVCDLSTVEMLEFGTSDATAP